MINNQALEVSGKSMAAQTLNAAESSLISGKIKAFTSGLNLLSNYKVKGFEFDAATFTAKHFTSANCNGYYDAKGNTLEVDTYYQRVRVLIESTSYSVSPGLKESDRVRLHMLELSITGPISEVAPAS